MPKYLIEVNYVGEEINALIKEGGTRRQAAVDELFKSLGGALESFYFSFGDKDVYIIGELPDNAAAMALVLRVNASGAALCNTKVLIDPEEVDEAVRRNVTYRLPGYDISPIQVAAWDNEGGHFRKSRAIMKTRHETCPCFGLTLTSRGHGNGPLNVKCTSPVSRRLAFVLNSRQLNCPGKS